MKTTVEVPDELYKQAKIEAARRGSKLKDLVEQGLRLVLNAQGKPQRASSLAALMKQARGTVDSGIPDLASNPEHLANFGRDALNAYLDVNEWQIAGIRQALASLDRGEGVPHKAVEAWVKSRGGKRTRPAPRRAAK